MINQKLTKILATIGPASESETIIEKLILAGVNIFRFNLKHNTMEWHNDRIKRVNNIADKLRVSVGILIDLQGPEIRINMAYDQIEIKKGDMLLFGDESFQKKEKGFSISHPQIMPYLKNHQKILADDGAFTFYIEKSGQKIYLRSESEGILKTRKTLNVPGIDCPFPVLVDRDFEALKIAQRNNVDFISLSFVRNARDIKVVRREMAKFKLKAKVWAKIERRQALENLDEIIDESDGVVVARGDLAVELSYEEVPYYQKIIIKKCVEKGIPVITATQVLQSMVESPIPTRAEISDIANAVYDLSDVIWLSAETATGKYPVEAVNMLRKTVIFNEKQFISDTRKKVNFIITRTDEMLIDAAYNLYVNHLIQNHSISGFLVFTHTGRSARLISRYHPEVPIFAFTPTIKVRDSLMVNYGVQPFLQKEIRSRNEVKRSDVLEAVEFLRHRNSVKKGDELIVLHGNFWAIKGQTSTIKVIKV